MINLEKEIREQPEVLGRVISTNDKTLSEAAAAYNIREDITNIFFAARGTSDHASIYSVYLFERFIGKPCGLCTCSAITEYGANIDYSHSMVIGVSQSGMAEDVLAVIEHAKKCGALTLTVTNNTESPLAKAADYHLFCDCGEEKSIAATKTFTSEMFLLANLCARITGNENLKKELDTVPGLVKELLDEMPEAIENRADRWRFIENAVVLGRGMNYSIALEGALKVMETNHIHMAGYAISDFQHGPLAQLNDRSAAFVIAASGVTMQDAKTILEKLKVTECDIILLTDDGELAAEYDNSFVIPENSGDIVSPYLFAVTMQLMALKFTRVRDIDPDVSDVLKKITVTK